jgi:outer membrane protein OmpA-like peptidoglycan-associated protein
MAEHDGAGSQGAPPSHIHIEEKKKVNWLAWLLLLLGLLALLFVLFGRHRDTVETTTTDTTTVAQTTTAASTAALAGYLAGNEPAPRTFTFDTLNFDTAKSAIRAQDQGEVDQVAGVLKTYPATRIRIAGYADTRGSAAANAALGKARADSVKTALVAKGIDAGRIETVTGGETDPVDTNATTSGQAENRRTELVVTQR